MDGIEASSSTTVLKKFDNFLGATFAINNAVKTATGTVKIIDKKTAIIVFTIAYPIP